MSKLTKEQLVIELERAATSMLTDQEIITTLGITDTILKRNYDIVEAARVKLKQRLNTKRISDAANGNGNVEKLIQSIPPNSRKGKTNNPNGRPKGSGNKISGATILASVEKYAGEKFEDLLAQGYIESIQQHDKPTRLQYEKMFLSKVVADKTELDVTSNGQTMAATFAFIAQELPDWSQIQK